MTQLLLNIEIYQPKKWDYSSGTGILMADGAPMERPSSAYSFENEWNSSSLRYSKNRYSTPFFQNHSLDSAVKYFESRGYDKIVIKKIDNSLN
jgi:hypothetical protein